MSVELATAIGQNIVVPICFFGFLAFLIWQANK